VTLTGFVQHRGLIPIAVRLCESADGVVDVTNHLAADADADADADNMEGTPEP
jgi:hypothetical protein